MTTEREITQQEGSVFKWPYPVNYGEEIEEIGDVLVIGSGMAGCFAAISAAKREPR